MSEFQKICAVSDLIENSGVAALVNDKQVAVFYVAGDVYALSNFDPVGEANVMSRGYVGDIKGELMVAAPLYKERYNLKTGVCLDNEEVSIPVYQAKIEDDNVFINVG
jgi:nitrite reductase (NADH) small subunit